MASREIILNVYDLHNSNEFLSGMGLGLFHTGVEIQGSEYSFSAQGIFKTPPRQPEFGHLREQISIGIHTGPFNEINAALTQLRTTGGFGVGEYELTTRNCNHFTDAFCFALLGVHIPDWINRAANIGSTFIPAIQSTTSAGNTAQMQATGASNSFAQLGSVSQPTLNSDPNSSKSAKPICMEAQPPSTAHLDGLTTSMMSMESVFGWFFTNSKSPASCQQESEPVPHASSVASEGKKGLTDKQKELLAKLKHK